MKKMVAKIWVPLLLVMIAAVQSFGIDAHRAVRLWGLADSLVLTHLDDTTDIENMHKALEMQILKLSGGVVNYY